MKARISPGAVLTAKERRLVLSYVEEQLGAAQADMTRRFFKLMILALRDPLSPGGHGMGRVQIEKVMEKIFAYTAASQTDEAFWERTDKAVIDQLGIGLAREAEREPI